MPRRLGRAPWRAGAALLIALGTPWSSSPLAAGRVSIVIDDLGHRLHDGRRAIALPAPIACAMLPHAPYASVLAREARERGKEVLLHLPMEADDGRAPGPGALVRGMSEAALAATLDDNLAKLRQAAGVNNHMGSRATRDLDMMRALMRRLKHHGGLYYLDSKTSAASVAASTARAFGVPYLVRDVFLDADPDPSAINAALARLAHLAQTRGGALAIGHPHPATLAALERWLETLDRERIVVVAPSVLLRETAEKPLQTSQLH